jgi:hypothetical protein
MPLPSSKLRELAAVTVGKPYLFVEAADSYDALRAQALALTGNDFLAILGDCFRAASFVKNSPGSVTRSLHKCGVAFDYNQGETSLRLVREVINDRVFWRTYLRIADATKQVESPFVAQRDLPTTENAGAFKGWALDFTALAESLGWLRIPAHADWKKNWTSREFWHYQYGALAARGYDALMKMLYG